jgi:hypothetical protein
VVTSIFDRAAGAAAAIDAHIRGNIRHVPKVFVVIIAPL